MSATPRRMPRNQLVLDHWADRLVDWGKMDRGDIADGPVYCFACGFTYHRFEGDSPNMERAHILARHAGGSDGVENLHLLCHSCHRASECLDGDAYWLWFMERTMLDVVLQEAARAGFNLSKHVLMVRGDA